MYRIKIDGTEERQNYNGSQRSYIRQLIMDITKKDTFLKRKKKIEDNIP